MSDPLCFDPTLCLIGGTWVPAENQRTLPLIDPPDGSEICHIARCGYRGRPAVSGQCRDSEGRADLFGQFPYSGAGPRL